MVCKFIFPLSTFIGFVATLTRKVLLGTSTQRRIPYDRHIKCNKKPPNFGAVKASVPLLKTHHLASVRILGADSLLIYGDSLSQA